MLTGSRGRIRVIAQIQTHRQEFHLLEMLLQKRRAFDVSRAAARNRAGPGVDEALERAIEPAQQSLADDVAVMRDDQRHGEPQARRRQQHGRVGHV